MFLYVYYMLTLKFGQGKCKHKQQTVDREIYWFLYQATNTFMKYSSWYDTTVDIILDTNNADKRTSLQTAAVEFIFFKVLLINSKD